MSGPANLIGMTALAALLSYAPALASIEVSAASPAAAQAYAHYNAGEAEAAIEDALRAVEEDPTNLEYRLLLADALTLADRPTEALEVLTPLRDHADDRVQTRLAQAAWDSFEPDLAAEAFAAAQALSEDAETRAYLARARVLALLAADRPEDAGRAFDQAWTDGVIQDHAPLDAANVALAVGRDAQAQLAFMRAHRIEPLSGRSALDAGYSAQRLGLDDKALDYFQRALATWPVSDPDLGPARRQEIEAAVRDLADRP